MAAKLGLRGKAYRLTTGTRATWGVADSDGFNSAAAPANLEEISNIKNVTVPVSDGEADVSVRGNNGFRAILPTLTDLEVNFEMVYDPADTDLIALWKAKIGKTSLAIAFLDDSSTTVGSRGFWADWHVTSFEKSEDLEEAQMVNITLKPALTAVAPEYVKVTA